MRKRQRIGCYGICRDDGGRVLLVRASAISTIPGRWFLPGGGLEHGEEPLEGFRREFGEETGLVAVTTELAGVLADTSTLPWGDSLHSVRIVYRVLEWKGEARAETHGSSDAVAWVEPTAVPTLPVMGYVTEVLERFGGPAV